MMRIPAILLCLVFALALSACGGGETTAFGNVVVLGVPDNVEACEATEVNIQGDNFLSEHGTSINVIFRAVTGTPFNGGADAEVQVTGTVIDDSTLQVVTPVAQADVQVTVTVVLPSGASGTSAPGALLLSGGQQIPPNAINDSYQVVGNVLRTIDVAGSVLQNDFPGGCSEDDATARIIAPGSTAVNGLTVVAFDAASANGGTVAMNNDGSFTYEPPLGFEGTDTFTYTMQSPGGVQDVATVTMNVSEVVWFINNNAAGGGNGSFTAPFNDINQFLNIQDGGGMTDAEAGDYIFFYAGNGTPYVATIPLLDDQQVRGEAEALTINGISITVAGNRPILSTILQIGEVAEPIIELANRNTIRGIELNNSNGDAMRGFSVAGPTLIDDVIIQNVESGLRLDGNISGTFTIGNLATPGSVYATNCFQFVGAFDTDVSLCTIEVLGATAGDLFRGGLVSRCDVLLDGCTFGQDDQGAASPFSGDGFTWDNGLAARSLTVQNCNFTNIGAEGVDVNAFQAFPGTITITNSTIEADSHCIDIFDSNQGQIELAITNLILTTNDVGVDTIDVLGQLNGTTCSAFDGITVNGVGAGTAGGGIQMNAVTFDADTGTAGIQQVVGAGITQIGNSAAARVEGDGLRLTDPAGDLSLTTLNVFNDNGTGLFVDTKVNSTVFNLAIGGGSLDTTNGAATFLDPPVGAPPLRVDIKLSAVRSTASPDHGVEFDNVAGKVRIGTLDIEGAKKAPVVRRNSPDLEVDVAKSGTAKTK